MSLASRVKIFLWGAIFVTLLVKAPTLIDQFHVSRFIVSTVCCFWAVLGIVPLVKRVSLTLMDGILFGLYFLHLLSLAWADNFGEGIFAAQKYLLLAVLFLCFRLVLQENKAIRKQLFPIFLACTVLVSGIVVYQLLQQMGMEGLSGKGIYKVVGHAGHKNLTASYLFLLIAFLLYWFNDYRQKPWYWVVLLATFVLMLVLRSRAVFLAVALAGLLFGIHLMIADAARQKLLYKRILPLAVLGLLGLGLLTQYTASGKEYAGFFNPMNYMDSASGTERLFVWSKTVDLIKERPLSGYGAGNWKLFFPSKSIDGGYRLMEKDLIFTRVHNDYLEVAAEVGLFGGLLYLSIFLFALWTCIKNYQKTKSHYRYRWVVLGAAVLGFAVISLFDFPKERIEHLSLLALLLAFVFYERKTTEAGPEKKKIRYAVVGFCMVFLLINIPVGYFRFVGDQASKIILSHRRTNELDVITEQVQVAESIWYNVDPMVIPLAWYQGVAHYVQGDYASAEMPFAQAYEINPYNFNVLNNYASTVVQLENYDLAVDLYRQALNINPRFEEGMFNLSFALYQLGQLDEALEWVQKTKGNPEKKELFLQRIEAARSTQ